MRMSGADCEAKKMKRILWLVLACLLVLCGCANTAAQGEQPSPLPPQGMAEYRKITPEQAKKMMDETTGWLLLDVRTDEEFAAQRIDGAVLIPDYEISARAESEIPNKNTVVLIYCRTGRRSALAAQEMGGMGYTQVYDFGGIVDWPYGTVGEQ